MKRLVFLSAAVLAVMAVACPPALARGARLQPLPAHDPVLLPSPFATMAAEPGSITGLSSPTHPDPSVWYPYGDPVFFWDALPGIAGYACSVDRDPAAAPSPEVDIPVPEFEQIGEFFCNTFGQPGFGDFDGDGLLDVATPLYLGGTLRGLSVAAGNGDGTFDRVATYDTPESPRWVSVADFNEDGDLDLALGAQSSIDAGTITVYLGDGAAGFAAQSTVQGRCRAPLRVADFDGDGHVDIACGGGVLPGDGSGGFGALLPYPSDFSGSVDSIGDCNNDGVEDVIAWRYSPSHYVLMTGRGDGRFAAPVELGTGYANVATVDMNADGCLDLVFTTGDLGWTRVSVRLGRGDGSFEDPDGWQVSGLSRGMIVGHLDGDGIPDVALLTRSSAGAYTLHVSLAGGEVEGFGLPDGYWPVAFQSEDFDGDGLADLWLDVAGSCDTWINTTATPIVWGEGLADGVWYFHVRGVGADDLMGPVAGLRVQIDTTPPVTTTDARDGYMNGLTLTATDTSSGMTGAAGTWYAVGSSAAYAQGTRVVFPGSGLFRVRYYSRDAAGNTETVRSLMVSIDLTPPITRATGVASAPTSSWQRTRPTVTLSASIDRSSVAGTYWAIDDGATSLYTSPFALSDGAHVVKYWSVDWAGNVEAVRYGYANVDSRAPRVSVRKESVRAASARKGRTLKLHVVIGDPRPGCGTASCTVRVKDRKGRDAGRLTVVGRPTNRPLTLTCRLRRSLGKGSYRIIGSATDTAGNRQAKASIGTLTVE